VVSQNGQILNTEIKYSLFGSWYRNYLSSINNGDISRLSSQMKSLLKANITELREMCPL